MKMEKQLRIPGPTPYDEEIRAACAQPMINHRGSEFAEMLTRVTAGLKQVFCTQGDVLTLTASGTGGLEAAILNFVRPGQQVIAMSIGDFGDRFADIAELHSAHVIRVKKTWGTCVTPEDLEQAIAENPAAGTILSTHNETSTGVTNPLRALAEVANRYGKLTIVDGVSSVSALPCHVDDWGLDVVVSASQKGWMGPPGLAFVSVSDRAWHAYRNGKVRSYYFDLGIAKTFLQKGQTPCTPAILVYYALDVSLRKILNEGIMSVFMRHTNVADYLRGKVYSLGLSLFPKSSAYASDSVTAIQLPEGAKASLIIQKLRKWEVDVEVAGGMKAYSDKIIRVGHMGHVQMTDMDPVVGALRASL